MAGVWQSERLIYRCVEKEDEDFLARMGADAEAFTNGIVDLPVPQGRRHATGFREFLDSRLVSAVVCIPLEASSTASGDDAHGKPTPIGWVCLAAISPPQMQHRRSVISIAIDRQYQGKGYGTEAIRWIVGWGFRFAGLHRIEIAAKEFNEGAARLYERMGFVREGRLRDFFFHDGRFWDRIVFSILENEWREKFGLEHESGF